MRLLTFLSLMCCMPATAASEKPNIIFILVDDMGWSDLGCYGSEIETPHIDSLAQAGLRFTQFTNTAKCNTSRACLLTGLYAQQVGMMHPGKMTNAVTLGEVLRTAGYRTFASGKHHGTENLRDRGFDHYYGLRDGCSNMWNPGKRREGEPEPGRKSKARYWCDDDTTYHPFTPEDRNFHVTDAFTNKALEWLDEKELKQQPFFLYLAYTAPHYPLHAWPKDIEKYKGKYDAGYLAIRKARYQRMIDMGVIDPARNPLPEWDGQDWDKLSENERAKEIRRMEIYSAMLDHVDRSIGRLLNKLDEQAKRDNTLIFFASDNGACAEKSGAKIKSNKLEDFGTIASYETVGHSWASVQNTPLRKWKNYSHEGGIRTPLIVSWPSKMTQPGSFTNQPGHLIDIMPTLLDITGAQYPQTHGGETIPPLPGISLLPAIEGKPLARTEPIYWQWSQGGAIRDGDLKAVFWGKQKSWELYNLSTDPNESHNLADTRADALKPLVEKWQAWMATVGKRR